MRNVHTWTCMHACMQTCMYMHASMHDCVRACAFRHAIVVIHVLVIEGISNSRMVICILHLYSYIIIYHYTFIWIYLYNYILISVTECKTNQMMRLQDYGRSTWTIDDKRFTFRNAHKWTCIHACIHTFMQMHAFMHGCVHAFACMKAFIFMHVIVIEGRRYSRMVKHA